MYNGFIYFDFVMDKSWTDLLERFAELGGTAENIYQREGELGRGIFPIDPYRRAQIMAPKNLFLKRNNISLCNGKIVVKDGSSYSAKEKTFLEMYYNEHSWGNNGNSGSINFLEFISALPDSFKTRLLACKFINAALLSMCNNQEGMLKRFINERVVSFQGDSVLAPVWELVNHSSFAPPLRINSFGVETPPLEADDQEILHKYSSKNSPMSMWSKYGFACRCIVAYSIPFTIDANDGIQSIKCSGLQKSSKAINNFALKGDDSLLIPSLPIGCLSKELPISYFSSIMSSAGLPVELVSEYFSKIREINVKARNDLLNSMQDSSLGTQSELFKALTFEIELIQSVSCG